MRMGLGQRIRQLRQMRGMTQEQLAGRNLTKSFISLVERDLAQPSVETLVKLARRLGASIDALLGLEGHLPDNAATSLLSLSAEALRERNAERARDLLTVAEVLLRHFPVDEAARELLLQQGHLALEERNFDRSIQLLTDANQQANHAGDLWRVGRTLTLIGATHLRRRAFAEAVSSLQAALAVLRRAKASRDPTRVEALLHLGSALLYVERFDEAIARYREAARSQVARHEPALRGRAFWGLGAAFRRQGDLTRALQYLTTAKDTLEAAEELPDLMRVLHNVGQVLFERGEHAGALRHFHHALRVADTLKMDVVRAATLTEIARVHISGGDVREAEAFASQAREQAQKIGDPVEAAEADVILAQAAGMRHRTAQASTLIKDAVTVFKQRGMYAKAAKASRALGELLMRHGSPSEAAEHLAAALDAEDVERKRIPPLA